MGFIDKLFGKKRDYAQEFKYAFLAAELSKCADIITDWHKHTKNDDNQDYADAMMAAILAHQNKDKDLLDKAEFLYDHPDSKCENPALTDWFRTAAKMAMIKSKEDM